MNKLSFGVSDLLRKPAEVWQYRAYGEISGFSLRSQSLANCPGNRLLGLTLRSVETGPGLQRRPYLFLCTPARLPRHMPRNRKSIMTIPIIATPSFMPSQTESSESTVHQPFPGETTGRKPLRECPISR